MGFTWPWWYPKNATFEDFFHFLPRRRTFPLLEGSSSEMKREISNTERLLSTKEREQEELSVLFDLRLKMKDLQLEEFQVLLEDIFSQTQYFNPMDTNIALSHRFLEMLERIHSLRILLVEHMGE